MREIAIVENGEPSTCVPGLKFRPLLPEADWCKVKLPVTSGERVIDWLAWPSRPEEPPYPRRLTIVPVRSSSVTTPPEFANDRPAVDAVNTIAPPKAGSFGLNVAPFAPPNTTIAAPVGKIVPVAKT